MKKLMVLGGIRYQIPVIQAAHDLGYFVITSDNLPGNIAHKYSDEYCNLSIIDKDAVLNAAQSFKIDGIMSFGCDPGVTTAAYVAEKMGLPSVGSYESVCILQNKGKFRKFLEDNGFNVPTAKQYKNKIDAISDIGLYHWPVIVKPTDSAGSKGVTKVTDPEKLSAAIDLAMERSFGKEIIIEDFLEKVGCSSDTDSFSVNGEFKLFDFNSQYFDLQAPNPYVPAAYTWPSTMTASQETELKNELQRLIKLLELKTSIYNIETRVCTDGKPYIMECTPRGGGNRLAEMIRFGTGADMIRASVLAAVGENVDITQQPFDGFWSIIILHSDDFGVFDHLQISEKISDNVVETDLWVKPGEYIEKFSGSNNTIGTLILHFDTQDVMENVVSNIGSYIKIVVK